MIKTASPIQGAAPLAPTWAMESVAASVNARFFGFTPASRKAKPKAFPAVIVSMVAIHVGICGSSPSFLQNPFAILSRAAMYPEDNSVRCVKRSCACYSTSISQYARNRAPSSHISVTMFLVMVTVQPLSVVENSFSAHRLTILLDPCTGYLECPFKKRRLKSVGVGVI